MTVVHSGALAVSLWGAAPPIPSVQHELFSSLGVHQHPWGAHRKVGCPAPSQRLYFRGAELGLRNLPMEPTSPSDSTAGNPKVHRSDQNRDPNCRCDLGPSLPGVLEWNRGQRQGGDQHVLFYSPGLFYHAVEGHTLYPPPHLQPGMVWIDLFRDASVTSPDQKPGTKISSGLLDSFWVLVDTFVIVCVHACVHTGTHSHASAITHHFLNLINYIFRQDILKVSFLAHFALLLTLSWPSPPATSLDFLKQMLCHQLSEVLQSVISLQPHAPIISMDRWVSFRDLT